MDGNNSLKRMLVSADRTPADTRVLSSDYFIPREYVDRFAREGDEKERGPQLHAPTQEDIAMRERDGDLVDGDPHLAREEEMIYATAPENTAGTTGADATSSTRMGPSRGATAADHAEETRAGCTTNWKAAKDDSKKTMWGIFDETGIFSCACRHGFCLWNADMVRSGEL